MTNSTSIDTLITEVKRLDAEATRGPWTVSSNDLAVRTFHPDNEMQICMIRAEYCADDEDRRNARMIAYYRTACPALAAECERLRSQLAAEREAAGAAAERHVLELAAEVERREWAEALAFDRACCPDDGSVVCSQCKERREYRARYGQGGGK